MTNQAETRVQRKIRAIFDTAQALADGEDPAEFPEFGFNPRVERIAEIFREAELRAVTLRLDDPVSRSALVLYAEALEAHRLPQFQDYPVVRREVTFGESRLDLMLEGHGGICYIETKSVTLVEDGVGLFPDAPTTRGVKHMKSLAHAVEAGHRAAVVFVVQRDDADYFATHDEADPDFGQALRQAMAVGVQAFAYNCRVDEQSITLADRLPFKL